MAKGEYRVIGDSVVAGHVKGEEFSYEYQPHEEAALIEGGHIELVDKPAKPEKAKEE